MKGVETPSIQKDYIILIHPLSRKLIFFVDADQTPLHAAKIHFELR